MKAILVQRMIDLVIKIIKFSKNLPKSYEFEVITKQLIRSSSSVGANYRSACRARSKVEFISKLGIVQEEADETLYWIDLLINLQISNKEILFAKNEMNEILSIIVSSINTAKSSIKS